MARLKTNLHGCESAEVRHKALLARNALDSMRELARKSIEYRRTHVNPPDCILDTRQRCKKPYCDMLCSLVKDLIGKHARQFLCSILVLLGFSPDLLGQTVPGNSPESATVTFYRPKRFLGYAQTPSVYMDGKQLCRLDNGRWYSTKIAPGQHKFESSMKHDPLTIEVRPGASLYLEMIILAGNWRGGGRLIPVSEANAKPKFEKLKPLDAKWVTE